MLVPRAADPVLAAGARAVSAMAVEETGTGQGLLVAAAPGVRAELAGLLASPLR